MCLFLFHQQGDVVTSIHVLDEVKAASNVVCAQKDDDVWKDIFVFFCLWTFRNVVMLRVFCERRSPVFLPPLMIPRLCVSELLPCHLFSWCFQDSYLKTCSNGYKRAHRLFLTQSNLWPYKPSSHVPSVCMSLQQNSSCDFISLTDCVKCKKDFVFNHCILL